MYMEAWHAAVHGVAKSRTWLNDWSELKTEKKKNIYIYIYIYISEKDTQISLSFFLLPLTDKSIWSSRSWGAWHLINAGCTELKWYQSGGKHLIRHSYIKSYFKGCIWLLDVMGVGQRQQDSVSLLESI